MTLAPKPTSRSSGCSARARRLKDKTSAAGRLERSGRDIGGGGMTKEIQLKYSRDLDRCGNFAAHPRCSDRPPDLMRPGQRLKIPTP